MKYVLAKFMFKVQSDLLLFLSFRSLTLNRKPPKLREHHLSIFPLFIVLCEDERERERFTSNSCVLRISI